MSNAQRHRVCDGIEIKCQYSEHARIFETIEGCRKNRRPCSHLSHSLCPRDADPRNRQPQSSEQKSVADYVNEILVNALAQEPAITSASRSEGCPYAFEGSNQLKGEAWSIKAFRQFTFLGLELGHPEGKKDEEKTQASDDRQLLLTNTCHSLAPLFRFVCRATRSFV